MRPFAIKGLRVIAALALCAASGSLIAANSTAQNLNTVRVYLDRVNMDYQMFKGENANPRYAEYLERDMDALDEARSALAGGAISEEYPPVDKNIKRFLSILNENYEAISEGGYEIPALADEMLDIKRSAQASLTELYKAETKSAPDKRVTEYQALSFMMQQMAALYLENAAAAYGVASRSHEEEKTIDQLAQEFSMRLAKLDTSAKDLPANVRTQLVDVKRKWSFIEQSMLNYLQDQVSFLVYRYSSVIVDELLNAAQTMSGGDDEAAGDNIGPANIPMPPGIPAAE